MVGFVGAHLSRSTFVLRKTNAAPFVPHETNGTSNVYPKKTHLCDKCAAIKFFKGLESMNDVSHYSHGKNTFLESRFAVLPHVKCNHQ
jgi:hypothetical protein